MTTLNEIINENDVEGIYHLKIDTEGHDHVILDYFFSNSPRRQFPSILSFESNRLSDKAAIEALHNKLLSLDYDCIDRGYDSLYRLNLTKRQKDRPSRAIVPTSPGYFIPDVLEGYSKYNLPHNNNLASAILFAQDNNCTGVTYQEGIYQARTGRYLEKSEDSVEIGEIKSWYFI